MLIHPNVWTNERDVHHIMNNWRPATVEYLVTWQISPSSLMNNRYVTACLLALRCQYNELWANKAAANLLKLRQSYNKQGERAGKILAWHIKQQQTEMSINFIEDPNGKKVVNPVEISETFRVFCERLYSSECSSNLDGQTIFLNDLNIPKLSEEESKILYEDITKKKIADAMGSM